MGVLCVCMTSRQGQPWYVRAFFYAVLAAILAYIVCDILCGMASESFTINQTGVTYRKGKTKYYIPWEKVERIALSPDGNWRISEKSFILFMTEKGKELYPVRLRKDFNEEIFGVQYRESLVEEISRYTNVQIAFISHLTN